MTQRPEPRSRSKDSERRADAAGAAASAHAETSRVRLSDVARSAGVSAMTVSRVVNGTGYVREATREAVQAAIRRLRYMPNFAARSLAIARRERIAVLHEDSRSASLSRLLIGVLEESNRQGVQLLVRRVEPGDPSAWRTVSKLVDDRVVGVILTPPLGDALCLVDALRAAEIPVVAVSSVPLRADTMCVGIDERRAAYEMTQHLLALGHWRIGFIKGPSGWTAGEERWQGFVAALRDAGVNTERVPVAQGECSFRSGIEAATELLSARPAPTAIFASCDSMAAAAVGVAQRRGLHVPGALTVVGFDDDLPACAISPELTTVRQPVSEMAVEAVGLLISSIRRDRPELPPSRRKKLVPHHLVLRASASAPARPE